MTARTNGDGFAALTDAAGVTARQLHHWTRTGYVRATGGGTGRRLKYSVHERRVAVLMGRLVAVGLTVPTAAAIARAATSIHDVAPDAPALLDVGAGIVLVIRPVEVNP